MVAPGILKRLAEMDQGVISDAMLRLGIDGWMDELQALGPRASFAGPARTLLLGPKRGTEALGMTKYAMVDRLDNGDVLVVGGIRTNENQMGDNVARYGQMNGLAAIVCDAPVRDSEGMAALDIPVFSRGKSARMPVTTDAVAVDVPIVCGGAQVRPGDIIVGSADGVLVLPVAKLDELLIQIEDLEVVEGNLQKAIRDGRPLAEIERLAGGKKKVKAAAAAE